MSEQKYAQHILDGFAQGALLDLRLRFAMQLLTHSPMFQGFCPLPQADVAAKNALDLSEALFKQAEARGWVTPIDHAAGLPEDVMAQAARLGAFQAYQQIGGQAALSASQPKVSTLMPRMNG